ncbi:MAG: preprotein translocase subunit SecE [Thermodesulfobacteriota bacterium]
MGRLLKKKDPAQKKKKQGEIEDARKSQADASPVVQIVSSSGQAVAARESVSQPALPKMPIERSRFSALTSNRYIAESIQFLREVRVELKKVTWPTRKQTIGSTIAVILLVLIISLFLGLIDIGLSSLLQLILK